MGIPGVFDRPYPAFAYSESRWTTYQRCPRAYYYQVYTAWRGWAMPPGHTAFIAYRLKRTTSIAALLGSALHSGLNTAVVALLRHGAPPSCDALRAQVRGTLNAAWAYSRRTRSTYLCRNDRPTGIMLQEVLYDQAPVGPALQRLRARLDYLVDALWRCTSLWDEVRAAGDANTYLPPPYGAVEWTDARLAVACVTLYAAPDLVTRASASESLTITDLKTGSSDGVLDQLLSYAVAVADGLLPGVTLSPVTFAQTVALGDCNAPVSRCGVGAEDLESARARLAHIVNVLASKRADPVVNAPLSIDAFPLREHTRLCRSCAYRGQCFPAEYPLPGVTTRPDAPSTL